MKTNLSLRTLSALSIVFAMYTGCAPQKSTELKALDTDVISSSQIVGGVLANQDFQKENGVVGLAIISEDFFGQRQMALCTGTLIEKKIILTAAHCIESSPEARIVGVLAYFKPDIKTLKKGDAIPVDKVLAHEDFLKDIDQSDASDAHVWNDIALLRLSADAPADVQLAKRPLKSDDIKLNASSKLMLTGFGISTAIVNKQKKDPQTGKMVIVPVVEKVESSGILRKIENIAVVSVTPDNKEIKLNQLNSKGACHGDSGGPAFLKLADGSKIQVGVTSRGTDRLGNCNNFAIYTDVIGHLDWIEANITEILK